MDTFQDSINEYRKQLQKGTIIRAYQGLMEFIMGLRTYLKNTYPDYTISGSIYYGFMDMTYFSFFPNSIKQRKLKVAIVFLHEQFRFEVWLAGINKEVQTKYWELIRERDWDQYHIVPTTDGVDSIVEHILVENPDFSDRELLTKQIEERSLKFIQDVGDFLSKYDI